MQRKYARVVELVDSLDSGSSAHSGRGGSSPPSRTNEKEDRQKPVFFFVLCKSKDSNPSKCSADERCRRGFDQGEPVSSLSEDTNQVPPCAPTKKKLKK